MGRYFTPPPTWEFAYVVARWASGLDYRDEEVLWWFARFEDEMNRRDATMRDIKEALQRLRRRIAALIPACKVKELDDILDRPEWEMLGDPEYFSSGFFAEIKVNRDWWDVFRLRGYEGWQEWRKERFRQRYAERGIDIDKP